VLVESRKRQPQRDQVFLAPDAFLLVLVLADDAESADSLAVQTHILGEGLRDGDINTFEHEMTDGESVFITITGGIALLGLSKTGKWFFRLQMSARTNQSS